MGGNAKSFTRNHLHGIIIIKNPVETFRRNVSTTNDDRQPKNNKSRLKSNSLCSIIGQFKSVCTKQISTIGNSDRSIEKETLPFPPLRDIHREYRFAIAVEQP